MREDITGFPFPAQKNMPFFLEMIGISYCDKTYHMKRSNPSLNVIEYIISGRGTLHTTEGTFYPSAGDSYLLRSDSPHEYYSSAEDPWVKIWVNFSGELVLPMLDAYGLKSSTLLPKLDTSTYINQIHRIAKKNIGDWETMNDQACNVFLQLCQFVKKSNPLSVSDSAIPKNILALKNYIDIHLNESLTQDICNSITCLSTSQTIRAFRNAYGMAPYEYMNQQRIISAKILLRNTRLSIRDISTQLGFLNPNYFSKYFRKKCGLSPTEYREYKSR